MSGMWSTTEVGSSVKGYSLSDLTNPTATTTRSVTSNVKTGETTVDSAGDTSNFAAKDANSALGKDDFLNLLVTQLRYQDPMQPQADTAFVAQLAQYSSLETNQNVEKSITNLSDGMNKFMTQQTLYSASSINASATTLIGKTVRAGYSDIEHTMGVDSTMKIQLNDGKTSGVVAVKNADGVIVATGAVSTTSGETDTSFTWTGLNDDGTTAATGSYTVEVLDSSKINTVGRPYVDGTVSGVRYTSSGSKIVVDEKQYSVGDLLTVNS